MGDVLRWFGPSLSVDVGRILRVHGYTSLERVRPPILRAAERAVARSTDLAKPEARMRRLSVVSCEEGALLLGGGHRFQCGAFDHLLADCPAVELFVLTLGPDLDEAVAELHAASELLDALFLETAGWLLVEQATRRFRGDLVGRAEGEGFSVTPRLGPGYDYRHEGGRLRWDLEEQQALFAAFDGAALPVTLMESSVMLPKMSRSGLFGLRLR